VINTVVDLQPVLDVVEKGVRVGVLCLGGWVLTSARSHFALLRNKTVDDALHAGLARAANFAVQKLAAAGKSHTSLDVHDELVATAISYAESEMPDLLKARGLDDAGLAKLIIAHLPSPGAALASPAPPPK
jgi:hypothetical protein